MFSVLQELWNSLSEGVSFIMLFHFYQEAIRRLLLTLLDDPHRKVCTAISMAVASIAHYDWPEDWPDLLPTLINWIVDQTNMNAGKYLV